MCVVRDQPDGTYTCLACRVLGIPIRECTHRQSLGVSDVVYFRNTGVPTINGCGYCKWAREYPPPPGTQLPNNPGWPGCCRAPRPEDAPLIDRDNYAAIVAAWDQRALPPAVTTVRGAPTQRRSPIPQFSSQTATPTPNSPTPTGPEPTTQSSGTPPPTTSRRSDTMRREREQDRYVARRQGSGSGSYDIPRQNSHSDSLPSRHSTIRASDGTRTVGVQPPIPSHWGRSGPGNGTPGMNTPPVASTNAEPLSLASLSASINQIGRHSSAMSDSGSESSRDSNTTVGTDSTDYLSDESEEELQRLAVERAMEVERQRTEEAEYESARRGLQNIELTPPQQWGMGGRGPSVRSMQYLSFGDMAQYGRRQR
ncbi:hypothetical protein FRC06_011610 [Ceratobasidium sp. 370]|nr:hypothetical protein FRC06_011610 [Ceratobasidium sp. 370]